MIKILNQYIKEHLKLILVNGSCVLIFILVFFLCKINVDIVLYSALLSSCIAIIFICSDFKNYYKKHIELDRIKKQSVIDLDNLPRESGLIEKDYKEIINDLYKKNLEILSKSDIKNKEMIDYYTLWAHQIKTPISAMKLLLQVEDKDNKELLLELSKIDQYVEMVLGYLRIESESSDLLFKKYNLNGIVRQAIRRHSNIFIRKNIKLDFEEFEYTVITDEKWLLFVISQLISNALKYTSAGEIRIYMDKEKLVIQDTGIGIAEEDLPRIFEKGFTGYNGRMDKKATGIGLYLCKKILNKLSHNIKVDSEIDKGTKVSIDFSKKKI